MSGWTAPLGRALVATTPNPWGPIIDSIAAVETPNMRWLRENAEAIAEIRRARLNDADRRLTSLGDEK